MGSRCLGDSLSPAPSLLFVSPLPGAQPCTARLPLLPPQPRAHPSAARSLGTRRRPPSSPQSCGGNAERRGVGRGGRADGVLVPNPTAGLAAAAARAEDAPPLPPSLPPSERVPPAPALRWRGEATHRASSDPRVVPTLRGPAGRDPREDPGPGRGSLPRAGSGWRAAGSGLPSASPGRRQEQDRCPCEIGGKQRNSRFRKRITREQPPCPAPRGSAGAGRRPSCQAGGGPPTPAPF